MGAGATALTGSPHACSKKLLFVDWLQLLCDSAALSSHPCFAVTCDSSRSSRSEKIVWAHSLWYRLLQYSERAVVNRAFSQIRGLQGPLTTDWSKLQLASVLLTKERRVDGIKVVNYTRQSRQPIEITLSIQVFQWQGENAAFICTVTNWAEVNSQTSAAVPSTLPVGAWQAWLTDARAYVRQRCQPSLLVLAGQRESIDCGNDAWLQLCEFEEADICGKAFSQVPGFQGPLTSEGSKLQLASLMISECTDASVSVINYARRSRRAMEMKIHVRIFKLEGRNVAFLTTVERVMMDPAATACAEPEPEDQVVFPAVSDEDVQQLRSLEDRCSRLSAN
eukprot:gb/GFBE01060736.1/.p1 GENE.gb/GFBE01060736.1/~~gb/GFBE01060736.1/.p1  ORF type:complete len:336 (+),score=60.46 gb/GFBE01060736.1/:1-1008(+)